MATRIAMRRKYGVKGNPCLHCLVLCFCGCCALVQEDKQVRAHEQKVPMLSRVYEAPNDGQQMMYPQPVHLAQKNMSG